ncbi:alpha/beta hydrolase [Halomicronema sp. CCY15110]|uniref:alpha/beta hydrolase n=1 Tax=Halomicronema sp. CCY15110 TaxID=2767773 RepID=UPI0019501185|nr:alpha/beta hydrolase [Halomicronema sp. CCY15110]
MKRSSNSHTNGLTTPGRAAGLAKPHLLNRLRRWLLMGLPAVSLAATGVAIDAFIPRPTQAADEIRLLVTGPFVFTLSVDALETFAETGEITGNLRNYARFLDAETLELFRSGLNRKFPLDVVTVGNLTYSPLGRDALLNIGKVFQAYRGVNGQKALRAAVIGAAAQADAEGWTLLDVLRQFPTASIDIELSDLLALRRELSVYLSYNNAVVSAIQTQAAAEAASQAGLEQAVLSELSQPGPYAHTTQTVTVRNPALRQTQQGLTVNYDFDVDVYLPSGLTTPAPVVIISHGFGDVKESFAFLAEHLASYGYVAIVPDHVGSDLQYREQYLQGRLNTLLSPMEFLNRPQEISFLIDQLEELVATSPDWDDTLNLDQIAMVGDSLGSSTTLAIAGAEINRARLVEACNRDTLLLNFALYLECRAQHLPPENYDLSDPRVKAVIAGHPLGAALYGPEGIGQIDIPLLMVSGSEDIVSPAATEQFHTFVWLQNQPKYLALLDVGTHFSSKPGRDASGFFKLIAGENRNVGTAYYQALSVAFLNAHLRGQEAYLPYLTARAAQQASEGEPMTLSIITSLTPEQIETAYGRSAPVPIIPPTAAPIPPRPESVLAEIKQTGVLKVALRRDAAPFGFIDQQDGWDGYCGDVAIALSDYLTEALDSDVEVQVAELASDLTNRFDLVRAGGVHLECGPNTIREDVEGVTFSTPFFTASTQFLVLTGRETEVNPNLPLANVRLGVLENTTTLDFVETTYPDAEVVTFAGPEGRKNGVAATASGEVDAFVSDGILSYAELLLEQGSTEGFSIIPEVPLTCEFYGLILPNDDPEWRSLVNGFLASEAENAVARDWFEAIYPETFNKTAFCLNR